MGCAMGYLELKSQTGCEMNYRKKAFTCVPIARTLPWGAPTFCQVPGLILVYGLSSLRLTRLSEIRYAMTTQSQRTQRSMHRQPTNRDRR